MGLVTCDGTPIEGVTVSDGVNVTKTDRSGRYYLQGPADSTDFILMSTPGGYETESSGTIPLNFARVDKNAAGVQRFDFELKAVDQSSYNVLVFSDMHLEGRNPSAESASTSTRGLDFDQFKECMEFSNNFVASLSGPVYGVNLGDATNSGYWYSNGASFEQYLDAMATSFPVYNVIGNHDHDHRTSTDYEATERYRKWLGPTYYSFNIGTQHYIAVDNMICDNGHNSSGYAIELDSVQLSWMEKDIEAAPDSTTDFVLLCHVPIASLAQSNGKWTARASMSNMDTVLDMFGNRNVTVLSGHAHYMISFRIRDNVMQYQHNSICGTWYYTLLCDDGSPASVYHYRFNGASLRRQMLPWGHEWSGRKWRVYSSGITSRSGYSRPLDAGYDSLKVAENDRSTYPAAVNLNLYEWQPDWTVTVFEDGVQGSCSPVWRVDFDHRDLCDSGVIRYKDQSWCQSVRMAHVIQYVPKRLGSVVSFQVKDENGNPKYMIDNIRVQ